MSTVTHEQALEIAMDHHRAGRLAEAESIYRQLHGIYPNDPNIWNLLGVIAQQTGHLDEAHRLIQMAIAANPDSFAYHENLGLLMMKLGRREEAVAAFRNAIRLNSSGGDSYYNIGIAMFEMGRAAESVEAYREALRFQPKHQFARLNLGIALSMAGRVDDAMAHYHEVLKNEPDNALIAVNLGNVYKDLARLDEAIDLYRSALRYAPDNISAINNLGTALSECGKAGEALDCFRRSLMLNPKSTEIHSNLIFTSFFHPSISPAEIATEMQRWSTAHEAPLRPHWQPHRNDPSPTRRLRIGYVSPDLRDHVVGRTLLPCFEAHDRERFEIFCYAGYLGSDAITARYRALSSGWRETPNLSDAQLAEQIRHDRIDVLVDLALHTAFNRLPAFAHRPAPVQIAWLGYPGATGLESINYRVTDRFLDPPELDAAVSFEKPLRLPDAWCCYSPPQESPAVSPLPSISQGFITFGSFNSFAKINTTVLEVWVRILKAVKDSRLLLVVRGSNQDQTRRFFQERGIDPARLEFLAYYAKPAATDSEPQPPPYLLRYHRTDIALDPFPYNGMTTTCDALWMGVPVIALNGAMTLGRASHSLLSNIGLPELAANSEDEYVRLATDLAHDNPRLASLRATLRDRMKNSPLLDAPRFARNLEAAYVNTWTQWCSARAAVPQHGATA